MCSENGISRINEKANDLRRYCPHGRRTAEEKRGLQETGNFKLTHYRLSGSN